MDFLSVFGIVPVLLPFILSLAGMLVNEVLEDVDDEVDGRLGGPPVGLGRPPVGLVGPPRGGAPLGSPEPEGLGWVRGGPIGPTGRGVKPFVG